MRKPDSTLAAEDALEQAAGWQQADSRTHAARLNNAALQTDPVVYSSSPATQLPPPYTLPPRAAARRHTQCLNRCVVGLWRRFG
jgi:hypothetical protein